ncbi:hypothetical protein SSX86_032477 [Deinandra increscens subsp. villosa]|uniref:LOB domain-containing protein n=1 Tax=Deinandra increscens subsp. villosa TaxID=3103831 RepID=A0AAP0C4X6_9ASTR
MSSSNSPCAACKFLRRKCTQECVFAPYFPPDQPQKFANVHKVFGASNVAKILNDLNTTQREDAVNSLAYEADARLRDPVYGCVGLISVLQNRLKQVQTDLHNAKIELANYIGPILNHQGFIPQIQNMTSSSLPVLPYNMQPMVAGFRESDNQHHQQTQLVAVVNSRDEEQMLGINYEQLRFGGGLTGSLGLGGGSYVGNMYQMRQQVEQNDDQQLLGLNSHQLLVQQETRQPPAVVVGGRTASEEDRSIAPSC